MTLHQLCPMLETPDLDASIAFYCEALGFTCTTHDQAYGWASLLRGSIGVMLQTPQRPEQFERPQLTGSLYFYSDDIDALWQEIGAAGELCYAIETFAYGMREFALYDNCGYLLKFGMPIE